MKDKEKLVFCGLSDMGKQRTNNEDAFVAEQLDENTVLAVAIDGVGGYEGGEVAAEIAKMEIPKYLREFRHGERLELLKQAVVCANNAIYDRRQVDSARSSMSCVLTSALIDKGRKVVDMVHVGDTRLYQYHHGKLDKLSHDHSLIGYREEVGDLTEEEAMRHPQRNVISRDVGSDKHGVEDRDFLEAEEFPLFPNSIFLLCSDGLTDLITSKQIVAIFDQDLSIEEKAQALIDAANEAGGKDNITVVLVEYQAEETLEAVSKVVGEDMTQPPVEENMDNVLPFMDDGVKKTDNKKLIIGVLCGIVILLVGACVALGLLSMKKNNQVKELEAKVLQHEEQMKKMMPKDTVAADSVCNPLINYCPNPVKTIAVYSKAIESNDFETISQSFAGEVRRYFKATNISNAKVKKDFENYDKKFGVAGKHVNIRWDTWELEHLSNGETEVEFIEEYSIDRIDTTLPTKYLLHYYVTLDNEGKIVSIYYDELSKSR